jgi:hypothetical protein
LFDERNNGLAEFEFDVDVPAWASGQTTSATLATLLPEGLVPSGMKCVLTDFHIGWGATAWNNATSICISDSNGTPVDFATVAIANTGGSAMMTRQTGVTGLTLGSALVSLSGGTTGKGLNCRIVGGTNPTQGSGFKIHGRGFFKF